MQRLLVLLVALFAFSTIPSFASSDELISPSEPVVKKMDDTKLAQVRAGSQVLISVDLQNNGQDSQYVGIIEVRDESGITTSLQYQKGMLIEGATVEIGVSWQPGKNGNYYLRSFVLSDLANPQVLSSVRQSEITVGPDEVEYHAEAPQDEPESVAVSSELNDLYQYALQRINSDRADHNIPPVELSYNQAAQVHADDVLKTRQISHWMTNGEKPYMTYSRMNGTGQVGQNVAVSGYMDDYNGCMSGQYLCAKVDPMEDIYQSEYRMMYEDFECCDNGHRDTILDKYYTHVSIGIAYDDYFFVMVQNFESHYISWTDEIYEEDPDSTVTMEGTLTRNTDNISGNDISLYVVNILYDPLPSGDTYEENKQKGSYESGELVAAVVKPLDSGWYYEQPEDYDLVHSEKWDVDESSFEIKFDMQDLVEKYGDGVYSVMVWCQDGEDAFVASGISLTYS